eukprot:COSAG06_NODE_2778_length_6298_cov_7.107437_8_plen_170_part_00
MSVTNQLIRHTLPFAVSAVSCRCQGCGITRGGRDAGGPHGTPGRGDENYNPNNNPRPKKPRDSTFMPRHARDKLTRSRKHTKTHLTCGVFCREMLLDLPGVLVESSYTILAGWTIDWTVKTENRKRPNDHAPAWLMMTKTMMTMMTMKTMMTMMAVVLVAAKPKCAYFY